ncbi:MAG: hypothetical protein GQ527_02370 [Bacteroidales bacterium]|nr:hypothetical protein [Bacteroidales bacterium]
MKKLILISIVAFLSIILSLNSFSQENTKDTIFSTNWKIIGPCKIVEIQTPNKVIYKMDGEESLIKANAIIRNNELIDIKTIAKLPIQQRNMNAIDSIINLSFNEKNYFHYLYEYNKAKKLKTTGIVFTYLGLGTTLFTSILLRSNLSTSSESRNTALFFFGGLIIMDIGIPLWIGGKIKARNNLKALEKCKNQNISLNMGISENGVGLVLTF